SPPYTTTGSARTRSGKLGLSMAEGRLRRGLQPGRKASRTEGWVAGARETRQLKSQGRKPLAQTRSAIATDAARPERQARRRARFEPARATQDRGEAPAGSPS